MFSIGVIILIPFLILIAMSNQRSKSLSDFAKEKELLIFQRDSIIALPWNSLQSTKEDSLIWVPPKDAKRVPDLEYAINNSKENKKEIEDLVSGVKK